FDAIVLELREDCGAIRTSSFGSRIVAAAEHQHADAVGDRAERRGRLTEVEFEDHGLQRLGQRPDGKLVGDDLSAEAGGGGLRLATPAYLRHRLLEVHDALASLLLGNALRELDRNLLEADDCIARIGHADLTLVDQVEDRESSRNFNRPDKLARAKLAGDLLELRVLQLLEADPAEVAADSGGRGFGELSRIGGEVAPFTQLVDDPPSVFGHCRARSWGGRKIDLADPVLFGADRVLQAFVKLVHFAGRDLHERRDIAAQEAVPRELAFDLPLERLRR